MNRMIPSSSLTALDFVQRLDSLETNAEIWRAFVAFVAKYGFEYSAYIDLPAPGERLQDTIICHSAPAAWLEHYLRNNYVVNDPLALHLTKTALPYTLGDVMASTHYPAGQRRILHERMEFGIKGTFNVPLRSPRNGPAMIGVGGNNTSLGPSEKADIVYVALCTHLRLRPPVPHGQPLPHLTDRERECLHLVALGKSDQQIGEALKISDKTANFHIESAKRKYRVSSRTLAAIMAAKAGVIRI